MKFCTTNTAVLEDVLQGFKNKDVYLTIKKADVSAKVIPGGPIMASVNAEHFDSDEDHIRKASEDGCLAFTYCDGEAIHAVPFDLNGQMSFLQRIGLSCPMLNSVNANSKHGVMDQYIKEQTIQSVLPLWKDKIIVLIREGMTRYAGSENSAFEQMQQMDLYNYLIEAFADVYPDAAMVMASGDNYETEILFNLQDEDLNEKLTITLGEKAEALVRYATSDVGLRAVSLFPFAKTEHGEIPIGPGLELLHKKPNTAASIKDLVPKLTVSFTDNAKRIDELAATDIAYPRGCFNAIASGIIAKTSLSKKPCYLAADELSMRYPAGCTALSVYLALATAIQQDARIRELSQDKVLCMNEALARTLLTPYSEFDHLCELA